MSESQPLLIEIGCEEIPARMIPRAASALGRLLLEILTEAGLCEANEVTAWGGSRRLAARVPAVGTRQADRRERVTGPPVSVAYDKNGDLTRAGEGFARKQGVVPGDLQRIETARGEYVVLDREVAGRSVGEILAERFPAAVAAMSFPKTMRWSDGSRRWVRPVHWLVALHGSEILPIELFGVHAGRDSIGHRFRSSGTVSVSTVDSYIETLREHFVVVDPAERRTQVEDQLVSVAAELGGVLRADQGLLDEVLNLVEWPGVVGGKFEEDFLRLPREILVVTLRHHQKCFSVEDADGKLLPAFLAIANTDQDPLGHIRRGNEWVVSGRLEDARFFWNEDLKQSLEQRGEILERVVFHARVGSYLDKARRMSAIAEKLGIALQLPSTTRANASVAARLAKNDLVTGTVGEFPELQGQIGGLMLRLEGADDGIADAVYEHYLPEGPDDPVPASEAGCLVSLADKLDSIAALIGSGETPTGSRDPFALRRASSGMFRILIERDWDLSLGDLMASCGAEATCRDFLADRLQKFLRDSGFHVNEVQAVWLPWVDRAGVEDIRPAGAARRLKPLAAVRQREDFSRLADLVKRVDTILTRNAERFETLRSEGAGGATDVASREESDLATLVESEDATLADLEEKGDYGGVVDTLARFVDPVDRFFDKVLVLDESNPAASTRRAGLLTRLREVLTRCFDLRELAGKAERETS